LPLFTTTSDKHGPEIEYLEHGKNGFVISGGAEAYADAVISLLRDRARYAAVAAAAREAARAYTLDNMVRNFVQGIQTFLDSDAKAPARRA
jgi:glycosyltransferase involved in cell wall biosynthesis